MVVRVRLAETLRDRQQTARLGGQVALLGVRAAHDQGESRECGVAFGQPVL